MEFKSWLKDGRRTDLPYFLTCKEFILLNILLNILSKTYHSAFGYNIDQCCAEKNDILNDMINHDIIIDNEDGIINLDVELASIIANKSLLRHKIIILRLTGDGNSSWTTKPEKVNKTWFRDKEIPVKKLWYEFPEDIFVSKGKYEKGKKIKLLGALSDRSYIHVIDEFDEIRLDSEDKGSRLSIDDVLFACRGLCGDDTRSIKGFNILSDDGTTLKLMVNIDNWSS